MGNLRLLSLFTIGNSIRNKFLWSLFWSEQSSRVTTKRLLENARHRLISSRSDYEKALHHRQKILLEQFSTSRTPKLRYPSKSSRKYEKLHLVLVGSMHDILHTKCENECYVVLWMCTRQQKWYKQEKRSLTLTLGLLSYYIPVFTKAMTKEHKIRRKYFPFTR